MLDKNLLPDPEETIGFVCYRTSLSIKQHLLKQFKENGFDITVEQWGVMYRIFKYDALTQNQIAEKTFKQGPNITRIIDDLEQKNLVSRQPDISDRRKYLLFLTEEGNNTVLNLLQVLVKAKESFSEGISQEEMATTINVLNKIYHNISSKEDLICT
ncbi:MAG: MarR family transcriptional regulator [bacterium]